MIRLSDDRFTASYTDANGKEISYNFITEFADYVRLVNIHELQLKAERENGQNRTKYEVELYGLQRQLRDGVLVHPPIKPLMTIVSDLGVITNVPFMPPLGDLVPVTPNPTPAGLPTSGAAAQKAMFDKMAVQLDALYTKFILKGE